MRLPNWWEVATPHKDIREGKMSEAIFAADLASVFYGEAPLEYQDPYTFFQKTYITNGLKNLLRNVLSRLSGESGDPVIQLQTPFGGGKTHALLALYHAVKSMEKLEHLDVFSDLPKPRNAKVVVFVGTHADPIKGRTPWGEIAYQLGHYNKVKEHDEKRRSPGREILSQVLGDDPVLILFDELVEYVVKAKDFEDQILAFSQEITETVSSKSNCCLVCTLPSSVPYGESGERALSQLQRIFGRVEAIYTPVEGVEIYEVIRKRLFESIGDEKVRREVAQSYFNLYQTIDVPSEVKELSYRDKIERAYPFHPELIDVLYEHWGSFPSFQRTRGVLRFLAEVVADLYRRKVSSPLIQSSLVNLENQTIRRELIKHIGNEYDSVIASDIAGENAKAPKIDKEMGSEYEKYKIASGVATSVFLYSFSGGEKKGTTLPRIRVALLRENIPYTMVEAAVVKLGDKLWYFHSENNFYSFKTQPNLNRVIIEKEETISNEKILEKLKEVIQRNAGKSMDVYLWPKESSDIPDNEKPKLAILPPDLDYSSEDAKKFVNELFEKSGKGFRIYKNTLFVIATSSAQYVTLYKQLKRLLALSEIKNDKSFFETITKESKSELERKLKEAEEQIPFQILTAYRYLALLEKDGSPSWKDLGIPTIGMNKTISDRVKQYLKDQERILSSTITPKYLIEKAFAKEEKEKTVRDIYEVFLKTPGMPLPENEDVILNAVKKGIEAELFWTKEDSEVSELTKDSVISREPVDKPPPVSPTYEPETEVSVISETGKEKVKGVKRLSLRVEVPFGKMSELVKGVIGQLQDKSRVLKVIVEVNAEAEEVFDDATLSRVEETLEQLKGMGAKIEKWDKE